MKNPSQQVANSFCKSESRSLAYEIEKGKISPISKCIILTRCTEAKLDDMLSLEAAQEMQFHATLSYIILFSIWQLK